MEAVISEIVALEWQEFQKVRDVSGRAPCQDDRRSFEINRKSQFMAWSEPAARSYLHDLKVAGLRKRNLLMEKYARMMDWTHHSEYKRIRQSLPGVSPEARALVEKIVPLQLAWQKEFALKYPKLALRGRQLQNDGRGNNSEASFEVYLRGELLTYSAPTLTLYLNHLENLKKQGVNMSVLSTGHMVKLSGYDSLEQAEKQA